MKATLFGSMLVVGLLASSLSHAQSDSVVLPSKNSEIIQAHLIGQTFTNPNYHDYALSQTKARWGTDTPYTDAQNKAIQDIETAYIALDKDNQQQLNKTTMTNFQPLTTTGNTDYMDTLTRFYQTETGKQILAQKKVFEGNKISVLMNLSNLLSQQIALNVAPVIPSQSLSSTQP